MTTLDTNYSNLDPPSGTARALAYSRDSSRLNHLQQVLEQEQAAAEATLGRPLVSPMRFAMDVLSPGGLGHALNEESDRVNQLDDLRRRGSRHTRDSHPPTR